MSTDHPLYRFKIFVRVPSQARNDTREATYNRPYVLTTIIRETGDSRDQVDQWK